VRPSGRSIPESGELGQIEQEIREDVQQAVMAMLPSPQTDTNGQTQVTVTFYEGTQALAATQPAVSSTASTWMAENRYTAALGLVVLVGGAVCLGWKYRTARIGASGRARAAGVRASPPPHDHQTTSGIAGSQDAAPEVLDGIKNIVRQNPEAAAALIRRWLEDAA
jgi:flagellar biosynthesis/type III secretory pathway M-ring protein FliF/YscJ